MELAVFRPKWLASGDAYKIHLSVLVAPTRNVLWSGLPMGRVKIFVNYPTSGRVGSVENSTNYFCLLL